MAGMLTHWRRRVGAFIGGFEAGLASRRLKGFQPSRAHVNTLIAAAGADITARARWLIRNNGYAANAIDSWAGNVVGAGIKPSSLIGDPMTLLQTVSLRERDPADYDWSTAEELADSLALGSVIPPAEVRVLPTDTSNMVPDGDLQDDMAWSNPERFRQNDVSPIAGFTSRGDLQWIGAETGGTHLCDGQDFPVVPGDRLLCRGQVRGNGTAYKAQMLLRFSDREDAFLSAASIGLITAFGLLNILLVRFGLVSLAGAMKLASRKFRLKFHALVFADGTAAVDVDNERTYGIAEMVLKQRHTPPQ